MIITPKPTESYWSLGKRLWWLAGCNYADTAIMLHAGDDGPLEAARYAARKLEEKGYTCQEIDGRPLSMTSLIRLWLEG